MQVGKQIQHYRKEKKTNAKNDVCLRSERGSCLFFLYSSDLLSYSLNLKK